MKVPFCYNIYLLVLVACPFLGRAATNDLEWLRPVFLSESGRVAVYVKDTKNESNLIIHLTATGERLTLKNVTSQMLVSDTRGVYYNFQQKQVYQLDFGSMKIDTVENVTRFEVFDNVQTALYLLESGELTIVNLETETSETKVDVLSYNVDSEHGKLVFFTKQNGLFVKDLRNGKTVEYEGSSLGSSRLKRARWDITKRYAYLFAVDANHLHLYRLSANLEKVGSFQIRDQKERIVIDTLFSSVEILPEERIVLGAIPLVEENGNNNADLEIWSTSSTGFTPLKNFHLESDKQFVTVDGKTGKMTSLLQPGVATGYRKDPKGNLYRYGILEHDDISRLDPPISLYKYDFSEERFSFFRQFSGHRTNLMIYKNFPHFVFYENNHWYYVDAMTGREEPISALSDDRFYNDEHEYYTLTGMEPIGVPLEWKNKGFYLNGIHDVWFYDWKTKEINRITNAEKEQKEYKICNCNHQLAVGSLGYEIITKSQKDLVITWTAGLNEFEGIDLLKPDGSLKTLTWDKAHYSNITLKGDFLMYTKEKVNQPPGIYLYDITRGKEILLEQSNEWDIESKHIKSEHFYWYDKNQQIRGGIVRFPDSYNEKDAVKYPVVVSIYSRKYKKQNKYIAPGYSDSDPNFRTYTADGYFVIEPDIYYELGKTGASALNCVNETIDFLAGVFPLDTQRMGIYGHSFGGYETNYVITQTPRFKAAVSSAGVADVVSFHLGYSPDMMRPDAFRLETQQWRFGKSFFDDPQLYIENSPIHHAQNITTPLLLITGKNDRVINWQQSVYMFSALKRLNKEAHLLIYDNEGHAILGEDNQKDMSRRMKQWFDYYLKNKEKPTWE